MSTEIDSILNKLSTEEQEKVKALLHTIAMQAALIKDMSRDLQDYAGAAGENTALRDATLNKIAQLLKKPVIQGPSIQEINTAVAQMNSAIQQAQSGQAVLNSVFSFAVRVAPLFVV